MYLRYQVGARVFRKMREGNGAFGKGHVVYVAKTVVGP